jgi:hypothetical protein
MFWEKPTEIDILPLILWQPNKCSTLACPFQSFLWMARMISSSAGRTTTKSESGMPFMGMPLF